VQDLASRIEQVLRRRRTCPVVAHAEENRLVGGEGQTAAVMDVVLQQRPLEHDRLVGQRVGDQREVGEPIARGRGCRVIDPQPPVGRVVGIDGKSRNAAFALTASVELAE